MTPRQLSVSLGVACLLAAAPLVAQVSAEGQGLGDERRVTVVDAVVQLTGPQAGSLRRSIDRGEPAITADEITVTVDGQSRPVVGIAPVVSPTEGEDQSDAGGGEGWAFTVYVDLAGSDLVETAWAVDRLLDQAEALTALGTVDVVLADPEPRLLVPPTRQPEALVAALAGLVLMPQGEDQLGMLRTDLLAAARGLDPRDIEALAAGGMAEERRLARQLQDDLLETLVSPLRSPAPGRVLFLISGGHDLAPERFYAGLGERAVTVGRVTADDLVDGSLTASTERLARTLDSYGWTVFSFLAPPLVRQKRGLTVGKWRLGLPSLSRDPEQLELYRPPDRPLFVPFLGAVYEEDRDPKAARSYLELGRTRLEQGDTEGAIRVLGQALHHFAEDAATATEQAETYVLLCRAFEDDSQGERARLAARRAAILSPEVAEDAGLVLADPAGEGSLALLADGTGGRLLGSAGDLDALLRSLGGPWVRVSYQMEGLPDGELHPLEVRRTPGSGGLPAKLWEVGQTPAVMRSATPRGVTEARLRRLSAGAWQPPETGHDKLGVELWVQPTPDGAGIELVLDRVDDDTPPEQEPWRAVRVSLGYPETSDGASAEVTLAFEHLAPVEVPRAPEAVDAAAAAAASDDGPLATLALHPPTDAPVAAVLVEDLVTGAWTTRWVELPPVSLTP
jgi:hypothetical protein